MLRKLLSKFKFRYAALAVIFIATAAFGFTHLQNHAGADSCGNAPLTPAMNIWPLSYSAIDCHDLPLIDVKSNNGSGRDARYAANQAEHDAGINVQPGDHVRVSIYFHNGASPDNQTSATAKNVIIASQIATGSATSHNVSGAIGLDNGTPAYSIDAGKGGDTKINSSVPTTLAYLPGSTQMCIRSSAAASYGLASAGSCGSDRVLVNLPDGVMSGGVNIGNVKACFDFSGTVVFTLVVSGQVTPPPSNNTTLQITKQVRNTQRNQSNFGPSVTAQSGDVVDFQIIVKNVGSATATNVIVTDPSVNGLSFQSGTNLTNGLNIGSLAPGASSQPINFSAQYTATTAVTNIAMAKADNAPQVQAQATVNPVAPPTNAALTITKQVRDVTAGGAFATNINSLNGNTVQYQIDVQNTGNATANNVKVTDNLPAGLNLVSNTFGTNPATNSTMGSITISSLPAGAHFIITFNAVINLSNPSCGTITNSATAIADNAPQVGPATAVVNVVCNPQNGSLTVTKQVRNVTTNGTFAGTATASMSDRLAYQITITANNGNVNNVTMNESLPTNTTFANVAKLNGNDFTNPFFGQTVNLGNLNSGQQAVFYFEVTVNSNLPNCQQTTINNTVNASGDNLGTFPASAAVTVNVNNNCNNFPQMSINKQVRNATQNNPANNSFQDSVPANQNDRVTFQIVVQSTGTQTLNNVFVTDLLPSGLNFISGSVKLDGNTSSDQLINNKLFIGAMTQGQQHTITFDATVTASGSTTLTNTAQAAADNFGQIQDTAFVTLSQGGNVNLSFSKSAFNDTKNIDATIVPANISNLITYTLRVNNSGSAPATNFVVSDDLSQVLNHATMVSTNGGTMNGNVISWPSETIPAFGSVTHTFQVKVNSNLPQGSLQMVNTFGNTVVVKIAQPAVLGAVLVAPRTGPTATFGLIFAGLITLAIALVKRKLPNIRFE